jgi:GT2 family glycosyltransferase
MSNVAVIVPSYARPSYLARALRALQGQTRPPKWILVIARPSDEATWQFAENIAGEGGPAAIRVEPVLSPGNLPPLVAGRAALPAQAEIVVITDDDAEAAPDALERLVSHYRDPRVAAVGGRILEYRDGRLAPARRADRIGDMTWKGTPRGGFELEADPSVPRTVDYMRGAWMSFRRAAFDEVVFRPSLNVDVAVHYEVDLGLQTRARGGRILYDPASFVRHYNAPRRHGSERRHSSAVAARGIAHNITYLQWVHLRGLRRATALAWNFLVGGRSNWGLGGALVYAVAARETQCLKLLPAAYAGRFGALRKAFADSL